MARSKTVSAQEELETVSSKVTLSVKAKLERIADKAGQKLGVWLREHLTNLKE